MITGTVLRSHAGGHVVHSNELSATLQCSTRGRLKKERVSIFTGDDVELDEINLDSATAVIAACLPRQNILSRPPIANLDQAIIVQAFRQPEWNPVLCDRYLVHCQLELPGHLPLICINKSDLASIDEMHAISCIYENLGYRVHMVSTMTGQGMEKFTTDLKGKVSVLAGPSGVGKSSLINYLDSSLNLKTGVMEHDFGVGRHTTTYSELYRIKCIQDDTGESSWIADTPGFSLQELKHPEPTDVAWQFPEITKLAENCKYSNCLHLVEQGCFVLEKISIIEETRYRSYSMLIAEAMAEKQLQAQVSQKVESNVKEVGGKSGTGKLIPKLKGRYRSASRRVEKQQLTNKKFDDMHEQE